MTKKLCIFISYKREDQAYAEKLWTLLGQWGFDRWLDVKDIPKGISRDSSGWIQAIHHGVKKSQVMIGLMTPESLASQNVQDEWNWAKLAERRLLLLRLRPFTIEDVPPTYATAQYIDIHGETTETIGLAQLQRELEDITGERTAFQTEFTASLPPALPQKPSDLPDYLKDEPKNPRPHKASWRLILRVLGGLGLFASLIWLVIEPKFEPLLAFLGALTTVLISLIGEEGEELVFNRRSKLKDDERMRKRVYQYWVQGVMQTALKEVEATGIHLNMQPDAVLRDSQRKIGDIPLPNDSRHVRQVYDRYKSFLILGDPGAGKTIMLLQLAESLILAPPKTHPNAIPLVLNLSSWALNPKPLQAWLEDETWRTYRVRGQAEQWLNNNQLILLLDGLDEVKEEKRAACVEAINAFHKTYDFVPVVVCSRIKDYDKLGEAKLGLGGAILLEALSDEQVERYLSAPSLAVLKRVVARDPVLREMTTTPFLLNTMIYAYRHETDEAALLGYPTEAERRKHLFDAYVQRRFADNPPPHGYKKTIDYLTWLATKMQAYVQTVFHPSDIQPDWMADDKLYSLLSTKGISVVYPAILILVYALAGWQLGSWLGLIGWGIFGGVVGAVIAHYRKFRFLGLKGTLDTFDLTSKNLHYVLAAPAIAVFLTLWLMGFMPELVALGLVYGLFGGLFMLFRRDDSDSRADFFLSLAISIGFGWAVGAVLWPLTTVLEWSIGAEALLTVGLVSFVLGHVSGFEGQRYGITPRTAHTLRRVILISLLSGAVFGAIGISLGVGLTLGAAAVLTYFGLFNGLTLLYPPLIWVRVRQRGRLPIKAMTFLDALTERQILRRMGGGYIFIHRYLLENFAGLDEVYILIDQFLSDNESVHRKALSALENVGQPALVPLRARLDELSNFADINRLYHALDAIQPRKGIGLGEDGLPEFDWVDIPAGEFLYGDKKLPRTIEKPFKISRYPVTYKQFQAFIDAPDGFHDPRWWQGLEAPNDHKSAPGDQAFKFWNHPRENVSWYDAIAFCRWLSYKLGGKWGLDKVDEWLVRLPTEYEWEKAGRGTDGRVYPYGNEFDVAKGNTRETGIGQTSAVGMFPNGASPYGVLDMSGNVWEWCLTDYYNPVPDAKVENLRIAARRVLRGGSWLFSQGNVRAAFGSLNRPFIRNNRLGFRLVLCPPSLNH